jgi:hypothetical protein
VYTNAAYEDADDNDQGRKEESADRQSDFRSSFEHVKLTIIQHVLGYARDVIADGYYDKKHGSPG